LSCAIKHSRRLRISPVSWLGGTTGSRPSRNGAHPSEPLAAVVGNPISALQSRGGDGLLVKEKIRLTNRLPEREIRGDCGGARPTMDDMCCRGSCTAALSCTELQNPCQIFVAKALSRNRYCEILYQNLYLPSRSATTFTRGLPDGPSSTLSGV